MHRETFSFDVFLSHSRKDREVVGALAERLRADGVRVWPFDGDVERGLESSRVLVFCMSANAFGAEWVELEKQTFRFRDPSNAERRFVGLRLDDSGIRGSLLDLPSINWRKPDDREYAKLLDSCRLRQADSLQPELEASVRILSLGHTRAIRSVAYSLDGRRAISGSEDNTLRVWDLETGLTLLVLEGHADRVWSVACGPNFQVISGSDDTTIRVWDLETGRTLGILEGHLAGVNAVACNRDGRQAISCSDDQTVRLWEINTNRILSVLSGHTDSVCSVAYSRDGRTAISGSADRTMRLWDLQSGRTLRVFKGHSSGILSVAFSPNGRQAISGSLDNTVRLWDLKSGRTLSVLEGHSSSVWSVACSPDGRYAISGSSDKTVRLWDLGNGRSLGFLEGHLNPVGSVAYSPNGQQAISGADDSTMRLWDLPSRRGLRVLGEHVRTVWSMAYSPDGRNAISASQDKTLRLWDLRTGLTLRVLKGHSSSVSSVAYGPNGRQAISGSDDRSMRLWDLRTGRAVRVLKGHSSSVSSVAYSPNGDKVISGSYDRSMRLWDLRTGRTVRVFEGHSNKVSSVAYSPNGHQAISGSEDQTIRLWDLETGKTLWVLEGHAGGALSLAFCPDGRRAISGSEDRTLRIWDLETGRTLRKLDGLPSRVLSVAYNSDGRSIVFGSSDKTVRLWDPDKGQLRLLKGHSAEARSVTFGVSGDQVFSVALNGVLRIWNLAGAPNIQTESATQYTNAKVLIVGDSGVGKTGLSLRLAKEKWEPTDSTVGAWATQVRLPQSEATTEGLEREIWLWDFGGQADQRLIHSLYMEETALAILVFDGQKEDLFESLGQWDCDLIRSSARKPFPKLLAAGRTDASVLGVSRARVERFAKERGFSDRLFETSAKRSTDCSELRDAIVNAIDWKQVEWRSSPRIFKLLQDEIVRLKDSGRVLMRLNELRDALQLQLASQHQKIEVKLDDVKNVVGLLHGPGIVWELKFGSWVLLRPEMINAYGQAVIQTLREDPHERGLISEERVLRGDLQYASSLQRLEGEDERILLQAMVETLVARGLCLREQTDHGAQLIFPSYYRRERPDLTGHPAVLVNYRFSGFLDEIYATLVVRLHHTKNFDHDTLWRYAADFKNATGKKLGIKLTRLAEGAGELVAYCDPALPLEEKIVFSRFVHEHLNAKARDVERLRRYTCPHCHEPVESMTVTTKRRRAWEESGRQGKAPTIVCVECARTIPLWDKLEEMFAGPAVRQKANQMAAQAETALDNASKERVLVGEVISTVALAGQISRELPVEDHGIDMEIEFKSDSGDATGRKLYLQLKSGDSFSAKRQGGVEVFRIPKARHAKYWADQQFPVMLVVRNSEGLVRWMEIRDLLQKSGGAAKQIVFEGERFDVMSVRRWRDRVLSESK